MVTRVYLGWKEPFATLAAHWLLQQAPTLPETLVVVPTSQAGRQLRYQMATASGAVLTPQIITPGALLQTDAADVASQWIEHLAWLTTLEDRREWPSALFPDPPPAGADWTTGFAGELVKLRRSLQENGHTLGSAARMLGSSVEADRWLALADLERSMESTLRQWRFQSRSRILNQGIPLPDGIQHIVLAGTTEIPPVLERSITGSNIPVTTLIAAPESMAESFSETGRPLDSWTTQPIPWPTEGHGGVHLTADTRQQAQLAMEIVATAETAPSDLTLGTADTQAGDTLQQTFSQAGWPAFHPASAPLTTGLLRWLKTWLNWLNDPNLEAMVQLLALPETTALLPHNRAILAEKISKLRDQWMAIRPDDLRQRIQHDPAIRDKEKELAETVIKAAEPLEQWRNTLLRRDFINPIERLLDTLAKHSDETGTQATAIQEWFHQAQALIDRVERPSSFWIRLMLQHLPVEPTRPPENRVIDVQGWLELLFEPGSHLVICGLNEGMVPATESADPWLGESAKAFLGLATSDQRTARDAYLLRAITAARQEHGRADLICAKAKSNGEPMLPSRLLLATTPDELPERVKLLFDNKIEPPDARLRWEKDWQWCPAHRESPTSFNATALRDYLACPFRYYLKHILKMQTTEPQRVEWNHRDFGNVAHRILERWGQDPEAREFAEPAPLEKWLSNTLDTIVAEGFGKHIPLAVRIQTESLRQRLSWFANIQAQHRADGWVVVEVEHAFEINLGNATIKAVIDRIDRHRDSGDLMIIDYKTGNMDQKSVAQQHRTEMRSNTTLPAHLSEDGPAVYQKPADNGKLKSYRWTNLQLPLYTLAIQQREQTIATPCYFKIGDSAPKTGIERWQDFDQQDLDAARSCAEWVIAQVTSGVFTPAAEKDPYGSFDSILAGRTIDEMFDASTLSTAITQ